MIGKIVITGAALLALTLAAAAFRPDTFRVERTASIHAPAAKVHGYINDMHVFNTWNPFNQKDPAIRGTYQGPPAGAGAVYQFEGNSEVGKGSLSIVDTAPGKITMRLDMLEPMEGHNTIEFFVTPKGDATEVTWSMHGPMPYISKVMTLVFDMDKMIGGEFDKGLATLKQRAEKV